MQQLVRLGRLLEPHQHAGVHMSLSELMALGELADVPVLSQGALAELLGLEKSTMSRLAARLEARGWIVRERDNGNRRYYQLRLTEDGRNAAIHVGRALRHQHAQLLGALTRDELHALTAGISGLARAMALRNPSDR